MVYFFAMKAFEREEIQALYQQNEEKFRAFYALLSEYNEKFNLTAITDEREIYYKHFYDSIAGAFLFPQNATVVEVGSGGGFPSIPLKLVRDDLSFTLVESTGKKCEFLRTVVNALSLQNVVVVNGRAEELARENEYREAFDICCARAVARLNTLAEYCIPFVKKGGAFVAYKGNSPEEVKEAEKAIALLGGKRAEIFSYSLPEDMGARILVRSEKIKNTPALYPRGHGKERKNPII